MNEVSYPDWQKFAEKTIRAAGSIVLDSYKSKVDSHFKDGLDGRPSTVTKADLRSEDYLVKSIKSQLPNHGIYGEEGSRVNLDADFVWYLDPIDGTTNFWRHIPLFGISMGLTYHKKPVLGVLYFPALKLLLSAHIGGGAYANGEKINVSNRSLKKSLYYISCQEARDGLAFPAIEKKVGWVKAIDASSYEFAQIAMGDAELYTFFKKTPHDMVAGSIIIQEAGGNVTDKKGNSWTTDSEIIIASNGLIHKEVLKLVNTNL